MKTLLVLTLALSTWLYPYKVASALLTERKIEEPLTQAINEPINSNQNDTKHIQTKVAKANPPTPNYTGWTYSKEEVIELIKTYSAQYGINPDRPLRIAACESGYNQFARNKSSSASGVFQFLDSTWRTKPLAQQGLSVFDADANVHTAVWLMSLGKYSMWECK